MPATSIPLQFNLEERSPFDKFHVISKDASLPELKVQLLDGSTAVSLGTGTATFSMDDEAGTAKVSNATATISSPTNGEVKYIWAAADVNTTGKFVGQFVITSLGKIFRIPNNVTQKLVIRIGDRVN